MTANPDHQTSGHHQRRRTTSSTTTSSTGGRHHQLNRHLVVASPDHQMPDHQNHQPTTSSATTSSTTRTTSGDHQNHQQSGGRPDHQVAVTHRIVAPPTGGPGGAGGGELVVAGGGGRMAEWASGLRFVNQSPGSLLDQIDYARNGAYSLQMESKWRTVNIWFARLVAIPGMTICYLIVWTFFSRLPRTLIAMVVLSLVLMLANQVPLTGWLIPDGLDFTSIWSGE